MIAIVNYGLGNILAFANIYRRLNISAFIASTPAELEGASKIILPGVGAFDWAMARLNESGLRESLDAIVLQAQRPILGICVGMQMMARRSDEGTLPGLGWVEGEVKKFGGNSDDCGMVLPHMGWNDAIPQRTDCLFRNLEREARFYFLHSYYFAPKSKAEILCITDYGRPYASGIRCGNIFGVQFHPEKSHGWGIQLLKNFAEL